MAWEWRLFCAGSGNKFWNSNHPQAAELRTALGENVPEVRPDFYHNVQIKECGLKERWQEDGLKLLELKILGKSLEGLDYWTKLPPARLDTEVSEKTGPEPEFIVASLEQMRGADAESDRWIERILQSIKLRRPERIRFNKKRGLCLALAETPGQGWKFQRERVESASVVIVECAEIKVLPGESVAARIFESVCVEGEDQALVRRFADEFTLGDIGQVMGYPKLVLSL
jgi:hypothetical protein